MHGTCVAKMTLTDHSLINGTRFGTLSFNKVFKPGEERLIGAPLEQR